MTVSLQSSVQNFKIIGQSWNKSWASKASWDFGKEGLARFEFKMSFGHISYIYMIWHDMIWYDMIFHIKGQRQVQHTDQGSCTIWDICPKLLFNTNLVKFRWSMAFISVVQSFWNFAQSTCSVQNFKMIRQLENKLWPNETLQDLSLRWVSNGYLILHMTPHYEITTTLQTWSSCSNYGVYFVHFVETWSYYKEIWLYVFIRWKCNPASARTYIADNNCVILF